MESRKYQIKKVTEETKELDFGEGAIVLQNVANNIRLARQSIGMSQIKLAKLIGYSSATAISLMETNSRGIDIDKLWLISKITETPINDFFLKGLIK